MWLLAAVLSAVFAALTSILAKPAVNSTDSDLATAIRTSVVLAFSWLMVFVVGSFGEIYTISQTALLFIVLSGLATGASWLCYFKALSVGDINKVVPIDKSSTAMSILFAIFFFGETNNLAIKLACTAILTVGILLMVDKKQSQKSSDGRYIFYAVLSAVFAAANSVLAKVGLGGVESNLATAIRTVVVVVMAWLIVLAKGKSKTMPDKKSMIFIVLSGISTGASWLFYYYALKHGDVSVVVPIDKSSVVITVLLSCIFFRERLSRKSLFGLFLITCSTVAMAVFK